MQRKRSAHLYAPAHRDVVRRDSSTARHEQWTCCTGERHERSSHHDGYKDLRVTAIVYGYVDWYWTGYDNAYVGLEWWFDNVTGAWYGYTATWDPTFLFKYGNQYLYYYAGWYYGYYYWR